MTGTSDDVALLRAHVAGDPAAFSELVRRHQDRLWSVAVRTLGEREEAADALQDALLSAFTHAASFRGDSAVSTWLHRIVVNACLDRIRRRRPTQPLPDELNGPQARAADSLAEERDTALAVRAGLAQLPTEQRLPLVLVDIEGYSVAEAAKILGVAEGTIKSRCSRGRARLAVALGYLRETGNRSGSADVGVSREQANPAGLTPGTTQAGGAA